MFGVPFHPPTAARACLDKNLARQLFQDAGLLVPSFFRASLDDDPAELGRARAVSRACSSRSASPPAAA